MSRKSCSTQSWNSLSKSIASKYGTKTTVTAKPDQQAVIVNKIIVPPEYRGSGRGTAAMELILKKADQCGFTVLVTPSSDWGGSVKRLTRWYRGMGFKPNKGRNKDWRFRETLIREPKS